MAHRLVEVQIGGMAYRVGKVSDSRFPLRSTNRDAKVSALHADQHLVQIDFENGKRLMTGVSGALLCFQSQESNAETNTEKGEG